jgi:hypothetical protein
LRGKFGEHPRNPTVRLDRKDLLIEGDTHPGILWCDR